MQSIMLLSGSDCVSLLCVHNNGCYFLEPELCGSG